MSDSPNTWTAELPSSLTQELILGVKDQIEKDFGLMGFTFSVALPLNLEALLPELTECIAQLQQHHHGTWMKVVYRVDLTEKQYKFVQRMGGNTPENMAKAVVLREFQKVYTRKHFS
ncbi:MAG: hypothetical protein ACKOXR_00060 [Bacteroidota bacterium]|nr:hypothetical protein [Bacteroidota bacterium]MBM3938466.1 hypothetical protein [Sphingomonadales bacterium]